MTRILSLGANSPLLLRWLGRKAKDKDDIREIKRKLRIELADMPRYLKRDIGLYDD